MEIVYTAYKAKVHDRDPKACAKEIIERNKPNSYFVLQSNKHGFFSPWNVDHQRKKDWVTGLEEWRWIAVKEDTFNIYMDFLQTRNDRLKRLAEKHELHN